jgi:hypothetical protein
MLKPLPEGTMTAASLFILGDAKCKAFIGVPGRHIAVSNLVFVDHFGYYLLHCHNATVDRHSRSYGTWADSQQQREEHCEVESRTFYCRHVTRTLRA